MLARRVSLVIILLISAIAAIASSDSITVHYQVVNNFPVRFVAVNMHDPDVLVTTAVATSFPTGLESWGSFLHRLQPDAAINGGYFSMRTNIPVGDIATDGQLLYRGAVGTALCISPDNHAVMLPGPRQAKTDWQGYRTVLCAGPRLLTHGQLSINGRAEGFRDPHVLGSAPRSAVAIRNDGLLLLITVEKNISLTNLAYVCLHLGAVDAMTLDGGTSSGLYAGGRTITRPGRSISNILAVYANGSRVTAQGLIPSRLPVLARLLPADSFPAVAPAVVAATPFYAIAPPAQPATTPTMIQVVSPVITGPLQGSVPIEVKLNTTRIAWCSLRINGQLRAMSNSPSLRFTWDSTQEADGAHQLEIAAWSPDHTLLAMETRNVVVQNTTRIAAE